jgi:type VI protein secretion system component VasK
MNRNIFLFVAFIFAAALCVAGYWFGRYIPFEKQWPLFEALRNTASIIFAVVGAWLAIIYPERLKMSFGKKTNGTDKSSSESMKLLMTPAIHSTFILAILLMIGIIAPIMKQIPQILLYVEVFRGVSFFILSVLTVWQIAIVLLTLYPGEVVQDSLDEQEDQQRLRDGRNVLRRVIKKPPER